MSEFPDQKGWLRVALILAAVKLALHLAVAAHFGPRHGYGFFVDEFYYMDAARHLAWGYVDFPPMAAVMARVALALGGSLFAVRLVPAVCGALLVLVTGALAKEFGAGRLGVGIACGGVIAAPLYLFEDSYLSMNALEPVLWVLMAWLVVRIIRGADPRWWMAVGAIAGVSLLNKYTALPFIFGLLLGMALRPEKTFLRSRWFAAGVGIAFIIALPNFLWQWQRGWPFLAYVAGTRAAGYNIVAEPLTYLGQWWLTLGILTTIYWLGGLLWLALGPSAKDLRALAVAVVFTAVFVVATGGKHYYAAPAFPILFAAGGAMRDLWLRRGAKSPWWRIEPWVLCGLGAVLMAPFALPAFTFQFEEELMRRLPPRDLELEKRAQPRIYPQFGRMVGWPEMARAVLDAYNALPPEQQARTAVYTSDYARAGAIGYYRGPDKAPLVLTGMQNYFYWGTQGFHGDSLLLVGPPPPVLLEQCGQVRQVGVIDNTYAMPDDNGPILLCSGLKQPLERIWPTLRRWE